MLLVVIVVVVDQGLNTTLYLRTKGFLYIHHPLKSENHYVHCHISQRQKLNKRQVIHTVPASPERELKDYRKV